MKKILFLASLVTLLMASCGDSFFDLEPASKVTIDKVYKTASDYNVAVVGCYAKLQSQVNFYKECCEYRSDNMEVKAPTAGTQDRYDINHFEDKPSNGILSDYWANFNNNIYRCNLILDQIDGAQFDETLKKQYKGEAMFIRALNYFNMYRVWGGVPATKHVVSAAEALKIARYSDEQMFDLIAGDLKEIVDNNYLPEKYSASETGRVTANAAKALLGKVYLTFHKWNEAKNVLSQLIGKYSLLPSIGQVFDVNNKNNAEIIFAVHFNKEIVNEGHSYWYDPTQESFRKAILDERQKEFPYEGHRWFDLVRMGYAKSVLAKQGLNIQDYQLLFPIPQTEIEKVGDSKILWQNPGYDK